MLRRLNDALPGLVATIIGYGLVIQFAGVWFVEDKAAYSIGLWYGIAIAVGLAIHIASVLWDAMSPRQAQALRQGFKQSCFASSFPPTNAILSSWLTVNEILSSTFTPSMVFEIPSTEAAIIPISRSGRKSMYGYLRLDGRISSSWIFFEGTLS